MMRRFILTVSFALIAALAAAGASGIAEATPPLSDGTVGAEQKISATTGGLNGGLQAGDQFGRAVAGIGDLDGNGVEDLAVGAFEDSHNGYWKGAVWILFMNPDGTVDSKTRISENDGGFNDTLPTQQHFGTSLANLGDLDGNGVTDLAVGASGTGTQAGAVWILFLQTDGTVLDEQKIAVGEGGFGGTYDVSDFFGSSVAALGDVDGDGVGDVAIGEAGDDDGGTDRGAVWFVSLTTAGLVTSEQKVSQTQGGFNGVLSNGGGFGMSAAGIGDLDGNGVPDVAVGAHADDDGGLNRGSVWVLFMNSDGTVLDKQKISDTQGGFNGVLDNDDLFGGALATLPDLDGNNVPELAVGAFNDDDGAFNAGAAWILFIDVTGVVIAEQKISATSGGFGGTLDAWDRFGGSVSAIGDLNDDLIPDLVVGANLDGDGAYRAGAVWTLFLTPESDDLDGDGLENTVDEDPLNASTRFSDTSLGGVTSGRVVAVDTGAGLFISDVPDPGDGVSVTITGEAGVEVRLRIDGSKGNHRLSPGTYVLTSGSLRVEVIGGVAISDYELLDASLTVSIEGTVVLTENVVGDELTSLAIDVLAGVAVVNDVIELLPGDIIDLPIAVAIDIQPGPAVGCINLRSLGVTPVAIFGDTALDVRSIDAASIRLAGVEPKPQKGFQDLDGDGDEDLLVRFSVQELGFEIGDDEATVTAVLDTGVPIAGTDDICVIEHGRPGG